MVNIHDNLRDENGVIINGRTKLFIQSTNENGEILSSQSGTLLTPEDSGTMFIVDDWLIPQIDKLLFVDGELVVKDGETIKEPEKSDLEIEEETLMKQLAEIQAKKREVTAER